MTAEELGLPERDWYTFEEQTNAKGRVVKRRVDKYVGTREVSLLAKEAGATRLDLPQLAGNDPRPFEVVGIPLAEPGYHVVEIESLRLGQSLLDKRAPMFVRTGVLVTNLGVHFKLGRENSVVWVTTLDRGKPVEGADGRRQRLQRQAALERQERRQGPRRRRARARAEPGALRCRQRLLRQRAQRRRQGRRDRHRLRLQQLAEGHRVVALQRADRPRRRARPARVDRLRPQPLSRRRDGVDEAFRPRRDVARPRAGAGRSAADARQDRPPGQRPGSRACRLTWTGAGRSALTTWSIPPAAKLGVYEVVLEREPPAGGKGAGDDEDGARAHLVERQLSRRGVPPAARRRARQRAEGAAGGGVGRRRSTCR